MQIEYIARIRLASRRSADQQRKSSVSDCVLAEIVIYDQDMFANAIYHFSDDKVNFNEELWKKQQAIDVKTMIGKEYYYYPNDTIFHENPNYDPNADSPTDLSVYQPFTYDWYDQEGMNHEGGMKLTVTGVLTPKESVSYGCLDSGLYYTPALAEKMIKDNYDSKIAKFIREYDATNGTSGFTSTIANVMNTDVVYGIGYDVKVMFEEALLKSSFLVGSTNNISALVGMLASASGSSTGTGIAIKRNATLTVNNVGGSKIPTTINIYPLDFNNKFLATNYLDSWNSQKDITLSTGKVLRAADRSKVDYTDNLEIIISMINGVVDIVTVALVAFTALSLVVSTVMIGIITFVSVMERVKEIGVIRSLGGRKKDVAHLFNAETFIIGMGGGLFGLLVTYLLQLMLNLIIGTIFGIGTIANLPILAALIILAGSALLTTIAGLIPASKAAQQDPVVALRTE